MKCALALLVSGAICYVQSATTQSGVKKRFMSCFWMEAPSAVRAEIAKYAKRFSQGDEATLVSRLQRSMNIVNANLWAEGPRYYVAGLRP